MECYGCGFYDYETGCCTCPDTEMWYACPIESEKEENKQYWENVSRET